MLAHVDAGIAGSQSISPHDYQSLGQALKVSAPSCEYPYATLDISRITAVQSMTKGSCGACLRVETLPENYIEYGETVGLPPVAMATHFEATTTRFEPLPTVEVHKRSSYVRYIYVLAVDTGGLGLDLAQVSFTALFGQSMSPMPAIFYSVDPKHCKDIWRNSTKQQLKSPTSMRSIPIYYGPSQAPPGLHFTSMNQKAAPQAASGGCAHPAFLKSLIDEAMSDRNAYGGDDSDGEMFPSFSTAPRSMGSKEMVVHRGSASIRQKDRSHGEPSRRHDRHHHRKHKSRDASSHRHERSRHSSQERHYDVSKRRKKDSTHSDRSSSGTVLVSRDSHRYRLREALADGLISVDTQGDKNLLLFKGSTKAGTPSFKRSGNRQVLGLGSRYTIARNEGDSQEMQLEPKSSRAKRYMDLDLKSDQLKIEYIRPTPNTAQATFDEYVPFGKGAQAEQRPAAAASLYDSDDNGRPDFRSLDGMAKPQPTKAGVSNDDYLLETPATDPLYKRVLELEQRLKEDKTDVDAWIAYIDLQEQVLLSSFTQYSKLGAKRSVAETQVEMYRRAMSNNPGSSQLVLGYLNKCRVFYDDEAMLAEWSKVLSNTTRPELMLEYVNYCQGLATQLTIGSMDQVYANAIKQITKAVHSAIRDQSPTRHLSSVLVDTVHRACLMFRDAGYIERAISIYQAVIEWYIMTPEEYQAAPFSHRRARFKAFWDSGVPRTGSEGAQGWHRWNGSLISTAKPVGSPMPGAGTISSWYESERKVVQQLACPPTALSLHELNLDPSSNIDPFTLPIFEDVDHFLIDIPWDLDVACRIIDRYMQFLGVISLQTHALLNNEANMADKQQQPVSDWLWAAGGKGDDLFSQICNLSIWPSSPLRPRSHGSIKSDDGGDGCSTASRFPFVSVPIALDTVDTCLPYEYSCPWLKSGNDDFRHTARNTLQSLRSMRRLGHQMQLKLSICLLEWTFVQSPEQGHKLSEQLLAEYPSSMPLWNSLAKCHARNGNWQRARRIWCLALCSVESRLEAEKPWAIVLRKSWAVLEALHGRGLEACADVLSASEAEMAELAKIGYTAKSSGDSTKVLRAKKAVEQAAALQSKTSEVRHATLAIRMWLAYLAERNTGAVDAVYAKSIADGKCAGIEAELAAMEICSIHLYHSRTCRVHKAADLRKHLQSSLQLFPQNTVLWEMFIHSEARARIENRVHRQIWTAIDSAHCTNLHLLDVYVGLSLHKPFNPNTVRWALKKATSVGECKSVLVWAIYVVFECQQRNSARARRVFYSAIRSCPWAKPLYLLALGKEMQAVFTDKERADIIRAAVATEIRTCTLLNTE
ncbi:hypothetical protein GGI12_001053 [Dipsacomyces acuminosporus]|nr:hypothetical protein GGI12_001053 [Dipsacomyces acuminosporus]